jgi:predicted glycosyltransferase
VIRNAGRILLYSHDSFGLGHLRRCRVIANGLAEGFPGAQVRILSGSSVAGRFSYAAGVEVVSLEGIVKVGDGTYAAADAARDLSAALRSRAIAIREAVEDFEPDLLLVDKEPGGIGGETLPALEAAKAAGVRIVLGLRDVMDCPGRLRAEWERKQSLHVLRSYYDELWVYGLPQFFDPLRGIPLTSALRSSISYTGYLRRDAAGGATHRATGQPYIVATAGGGADGDGLVDAVLRAYECDAWLPYPAIVVLGPFMPAARHSDFADRARRLERVSVHRFHSALDSLITSAAGVVSMAGYNSFCEILSHDKRALLAPRRAPRMEQAIRTERAAELGLVEAADEETLVNPGAMAAALRRMPGRPRPSAVFMPGLLDGLQNIERLTAPWLRADVADRRHSFPLGRVVYASHRRAAPRTPLASPCAAGTRGVSARPP